MKLRVDIQGLRAIAVGLVVAYHLAPERLTGGFVGVDVFFVISGFLITSHLLARPPRGMGDLAAFWGRRIRRLLPASLLVLGFTVVGSRLVLPDTRWAETAAQVKAAALYVVNWRLADQAVDYLASTNAASPVQHFWSLSVEEQFYLGWPIVILLLSLLVVVTGRRKVLGLGMLAVVLASLAWSIHLTHADPASAYFVTPTRVWELGAGGLVALADPTVRLRAVYARALAWVGLAAVAVTAVVYDGTTPFPGWTAAVPVLGTMAVIWARADTHEASPVRWLAPRPVQWFGGVSYSVYLWHWPLIVLLPAARRAPRGWVDDVVIVALTLVLAALTKRYVEDPFRTASWARPLPATYLMGVTGMALVLAMSAGLSANLHHRQSIEASRLAAALDKHGPCFGAAALDPGVSCPPNTGEPVPAPALAAADVSDAYRPQQNGEDCWALEHNFAPVTCSFGKGKIDVALVGNSHSGEWLPALQRIAKKKHWHITTYMASQCAASDVDQAFGSPSAVSGCRAWSEWAAARVRADHPDLIVFSNRMSLPVVGKSRSQSVPLYAAGMVKLFQQWTDIPVVLIRDTPAAGDGTNSIPDCLAAHPGNYAACDGLRSVWEPPDPGLSAAKKFDNIRVADLNDHICGPKICTAVVGGVVPFFDGSHLTATFARTLAPYLAPELIAALDHR